MGGLYIYGMVMVLHVASAVYPLARLLLPAAATEQRTQTKQAVSLQAREFSACKQSWQVKHVDGEREVKGSCSAQWHTGRQKVTHVSNQETFHAAQWSSVYFRTLKMTCPGQNSKCNDYLMSCVMMMDTIIVAGDISQQAADSMELSAFCHCTARVSPQMTPRS